MNMELVVCPHCKRVVYINTELSNDNQYKCGECLQDFNFTDFQAMNVLQINGDKYVTLDELKIYIGNERYYNNAFDRIYYLNKSSFNWFAFLFDGFWFLSHKMILFTLIILFTDFIIESLTTPFVIIVYIGLKIILGIYGNKILYKYSILKILKIKSKYHNSTDIIIKIENKGKSSQLYVFIGLLSPLILSILFLLIRVIILFFTNIF